MFNILYEHNDFILIVKAADVSFHRDTEESGLVQAVRSALGREELYSVHRLDKITSGLLLFAKNRDAAQQLSSMFRNRQLEKYYLAISDRRPHKTQGLIKGEIVKSRRGGWKLTRTLEHASITQFFSYPIGRGLRLFILKPHTGKTHQLRVVMKSLGAPILGDPIYHAKEPEEKEPDRGYLHSYALRFVYKDERFEFLQKPDSGELFLNEAFSSALQQCERPWELTWPAVKQGFLN